MASSEQLKRSFSVDRARREYARVAWFYDAWGRLTEDRALQRLLQVAEVKDGSRVLDVGVGTGRLFTEVVQQNPSGANLGLDLSPAMLAHARKRLDEVVLPQSWQLVEGNVYSLPFDAEGFDFVFSTFLLDMLPAKDYPALLAALRRILKPNGRLCLAAFSFGTRPVHRLWYWIARQFPALLTDCRPVQLEPVLRAAGYTILLQEEMSQFTFPSQLIVASPAGA